MKLFAPRNDWNVRSDQSWWGYVGGGQTVAGVRVNEDIAMTFSAWFAGVRIISETLASIPCRLLEQQDYRTTKTAIDHPVFSLLHDQPNPEQDIMGWVDMQAGLQVNWGNAYAEKQRSSTGEIKALWPIHPSRIPLKNIRRNGVDPSTWDEIEAGQPGEIVYWVNNDDNASPTPIPASDMLHIPGVQSANGITGQSVVRFGANSVGIGLATEKHAGALFKQGAVSNVVITSPKVVAKDTADRLRNQWQKSFGSVENHYKTLLLEDGMKAEPIDMDPERSQLILARQFGVTEVARWLRLPPHMLADLTKSSFSNIEQQSIDFVMYSLKPWVTRWEKALRRQLLTDEEKKRFFFRFDVDDLLRGDSAARTALFRAEFDMGSLSPNDIREAEHRNPVEGGDIYMVPGNNLVTLAQMNKQAEDAMKPPETGTPAGGTPGVSIDGASTDVQSTALNGGQIVALIDIATKLVTEQLPPEGTHALIEAAFPAMDTKLIDTIVDELDAFTPEPPEPAGDLPGSTEPPPEPMPPAEPKPDPMMDQIREILSQVSKTPTRDDIDRLIAERETAESERLALREIEARKVASAARDCLLLSIEATLEGWMGYEARAAKRAAEKPETFMKWRDEFYDEFHAKLCNALEPFAAAAQPIGFTFDASVASRSYVQQSISSLEPLIDLPCKEFIGSLERVSAAWSDRPKRFAAELLKGGAV